MSIKVVVDAPDQAKPGDIIDVKVIVVNAVDDFDAGQFDMVVDSTLAKFLSAEPGYIGDDEDSYLFINPEYAENTVRVGVNYPGVRKDIDGIGVLATMKYEVVGVGENVTFSIENGFLNDWMAIEIPSVWSGDTSQFFLRGDSRMDGVLDDLDITHVADCILGLASPTVATLDIKGGTVNTSTLTELERIIAGLS